MAAWGAVGCGIAGTATMIFGLSGPEDLLQAVSASPGPSAVTLLDGVGQLTLMLGGVVLAMALRGPVGLALPTLVAIALGGALGSVPRAWFWVSSWPAILEGDESVSVLDLRLHSITWSLGPLLVACLAAYTWARHRASFAAGTSG